MSEADERLVVMLEARITEFERRMAAAERRGTRTHSQLTRGAKSAAASMERDLVTATQRINAALATGATRVGQFAAAFAGGLAGGAVLQLVGSLNLQIAGTVKALAEVGDQAKRAGVSVEAFQELRYVAEQNRIGVDALTDGLKEMNLRLDEFVTTGAGPAAESLARLGYTAAELRAKMADPSALLLEMVGRMEALDKAAQIRVADEVFGGTAGERFVELLSLGEDGIRKQMDRAGELGLVLDQDVIAKAAELDAKFAEVSGRINSMWQQAVVEAGYYFGFVERERAKLTYDSGEAARLVGPELADTLGQAGEVGQDTLAIIESLAIEYGDLATAARQLVPMLSDASNMMRGLGDEATAVALTDLAARMDEAARAFADGGITGEEFAGILQGVATEAATTLAALDELDAARLGGVTGAVADLLGWIQELPGAVAAARSEINSLDNMSTGTPLSGDGASLLPPGPGQINSSPRPRAAPAMLGEGAGTSGRRGGGGGGSSRIEALLSELQTEREVLDAWYAESLELVNSATDAQLEALGGRHEAMERLETEHMERLRAIRDEGQGSMLDDTAGFFGALASIAAVGGQKTAKAVAVAQAIEGTVNAYGAAIKALNTPGLSVWGRFAAYASVLGAGLKGVAAIRAAGGVGGGGGGSGGASAGSSAPAAAAAEPAPLRAMIEGLSPDELYSGKAVRTLLDRLMQEAGDRGIILVGGRA